MPRERRELHARHSHPELVDVLAIEMGKKGVSSTPSVPTIYEEPQPYGESIHVKVIWDRWAGVPVQERGSIILDAYEKAGLGSEIPKITLVLGLTVQEAEDLQIDC